MSEKIKKAKDGRANNKRPTKLTEDEKKKHTNVYIEKYKIDALGGYKAVQKIATIAVNVEYNTLISRK